MLQDATGLDGDRIVGGVDLANPVQASEAEDDGVVFGEGDTACDETGVAALGHDGDTCFGAESHSRGNLLGG